MTEIFDACRWVNQYLGVIACVCVTWRLVPLVLDRARWRETAARHRTIAFGVLAGYALLSALAAAHYDGRSPAQWFSAVFTLLHVVTIALCLWWPHPTRLARSAV